MRWREPIFSLYSAVPMRETLVASYILALLAAVGAQTIDTQAPIAPRITNATCPVRNFADLQRDYIRYPVCWGPIRVTDPKSDGSGSQSSTTWEASISATATAGAATPEESDQETDTESPLDNAKFLSFEEWKKQNLAKAGQSAENVRGNRQAEGSQKGTRPRPDGINNALDSLGDDTEIELEFNGFGPEDSVPVSWGRKVSDGAAPSGEARKDAAEEQNQADGSSHGGVARRKDAGTTCKERFNYASFDCAATVLKTNPECTGSSSILIENKDSYMLNECRAKDKFVILELCDDILIDTIVLANYEFFSSIFRTFRVSVADRYPSKPDKWKELGTYEAMNTREVQAFAVDVPLIWARYVKIEFLTHYGNEFFCPVSLVRVHGTTMMEEYKSEGESARAEEEAISSETQEAASSSDAPSSSLADTQAEPKEGNAQTSATGSTATPTRVVSHDICIRTKSDVENILLNSTPYLEHPVCFSQDMPQAEQSQVTVSTQLRPQIPSRTPVADAAAPTTSTVEGSSSTEATAATPTESETEKPSQETGELSPTAKDETETSTMDATKSTVSTAQHPPPPNPTTQESFFKSVNKRLHMLESNSSLSLQYIEEQSRILREAFNKVEKRQLSKTSTFLENLNTTVLNELREFRQQYDNVWQSVVIEFEQQRQQYSREVFSVTTQLGVLADELVFQKRVSIIQSIFVLVCFGLVLFSRTTASSYLEFPRVHSMMSRSQSFRSASPSFETPSASPPSRPPSSYRDKHGGHQRSMSDESRDEDAPNPTISYAPPTPISDAQSQSDGEDKASRYENSLRSSSAASSVVQFADTLQLTRADSSPPSLGRRDDTDRSSLDSQR